MCRVSFHDLIDHLPTLDNIPHLPGAPEGATWGLWDRDGVRDEFGTLNMISCETIVDAAQEVREGVSVSLKSGSSNVPDSESYLRSPSLPMNIPSIAVFERERLQHTIRDNSTFSNSQSFDDTLRFNTQAGSQWDGLRHVLHAKTGTLYNGVKKTEIIGPDATDVLGINKWHEKGCITGRGVLIDYVSYAKRHDIRYDASKCHPIFHQDLEKALHEQGVVVKRGDILLVRSGFLKWYNECPDATARDAWFTNPLRESVGVAANQETITWVWNHHFAAVAGDCLAWEALPQPIDSPSFHEYLIPLWGTPIGELWDLERLAECCQKFQRWSFFITSVPLNIPGGVASPPNAVAIF